MPNLLSQITRDSTSQQMSIPTIPPALARHSAINDKKVIHVSMPPVPQHLIPEDPIETTNLPLQTSINPPVFNYVSDRFDDEKTNKKIVKYLPGERLLEKLEKNLKKKDKDKKDKKHIDILSNSIENVIRDLTH